MSFLSKALAAHPADALKPELLGSIRVAVVGDPSVGKTALTEVSRDIAGRAMSDTAACASSCHS
jgi:DNA replicative helicase MCM subunit Mcm2 (Cdc46/Mcm family)